MLSGLLGQPPASRLHLLTTARSSEPGNHGKPLSIILREFGPGKNPLPLPRLCLLVAQHHKALFQGPAPVFTAANPAGETTTENRKMGLKFFPSSWG
ncbi:MAG: hypothetical protein PVI97_06720 [Candidatus Thiodiazotropha sp.]